MNHEKLNEALDLLGRSFRAFSEALDVAATLPAPSEPPKPKAKPKAEPAKAPVVEPQTESKPEPAKTEPQPEVPAAEDLRAQVKSVIPNAALKSKAAVLAALQKYGATKQSEVKDADLAALLVDLDAIVKG